LQFSRKTRWPTRHYPRLWIQRPSSERRRDFNPPDSCAAQRTLWPLLTSRSKGLAATVALSGASEISPGKNIDLRCTTAGSTSPCLGHESFAVTCPLALLGSAFYPVPVRRPAASLPASFTPASRSDALRFTSLAVTSSREDFHLQVNAHAGRTRKRKAALGPPFSIQAPAVTSGPRLCGSAKRHDAAFTVVPWRSNNQLVGTPPVGLELIGR
jgi:hypothetical protein